jgi:hypothetical protein
MADQDPMRGSFRWTWKRGREHLATFLVGGVILGVLAIIIGNVVTAPLNASLNERIAYAVTAFLAAVGVAALAAFGVAFIRASYEQRNALRIEIQRLKALVVALTAQRDALVDNDLNAAVLHHRTIRLIDLPMDANGIVRGKRFEYCVIRGPGLIGVLRGTNLSGLEFQGPIGGLVWIAPKGLVVGVVGLEYCEFLGCRMEHIAIATSPKQAPYLMKMLSGEIKGYKIGKGEDDITVIK